MIKFDENGFALDSGLVLVSITDTENIYLGEEEQFVSEGCGLAQYAYFDKPTMQQKDGFVIVRKNDEWLQLEDHREKTAYSIKTGEAVTIKNLGALPSDVTFEPMPNEYYTWNGTQWVLTAEAEQKQQLDNQAQQISLAQTELPAVQNEVRLLEKKRDKNRASSIDLERLDKLEDYAFDLDDFITGQRPDLPSKPE